MNTVVRLLKKAFHEICFRIKLKNMDEIWYFMGGGCFGTFPPSFYYTHTQEEIERITEEKVAEIEKMIEQINKKNRNPCFFEMIRTYYQ